ncbi:MAG TPA: M20/M25/M40 family metallo-hydrolase [Streptosporangiaceae bacterium]|nr:M20/M25/M40 family metallo-hydrolase [Streptosporangiaceae bacterium]
MTDATDLAQAADPVPLLQRLIRFRSVNPPGDEGPCIGYLADLLGRAGLDVKLVHLDPERPNLIARLPGRQAAPALLLHAHADVVPVAGQEWTVPPFDGLLADGHVWGRGAIDMKGQLAMMISAILTLRTAGQAPAGDVILAISPDEEAGSAVGARYLTEQHPELFTGIKDAIGEDGGAVISCTGQRVHPIVVAEKRACWLRITLRGPAGHASRQGRTGTAMAKLADLLGRLQSARLPAHLTPATDLMLSGLADLAAEPLASRLQALRDDALAPVPYDLLPEADAVYIDSVLRNTVNATIVRTSDKINILPALITIDLDGRILPGAWTADDYIGELREVIGAEPEIELLLEGEPMPAFAPGPFYDALACVLTEADPGGVPLPMVTPASTDARLFAGLGIACYGWMPMLTPPGSRYQDAMHAGDERIPVDALRFGAECMRRVLVMDR